MHSSSLREQKLHENKILGGAGISELKESNSDICELQKMYFHKSIRGKGLGDRMIDKCLTFAIKSNFTKKEFLKLVNKAKKYISIGDIFQVVISQRFEKKLTKDPLVKHTP